MAPKLPKTKKIGQDRPACHNYNLRPRVKTAGPDSVTSYISSNQKLPSCSLRRKVPRKGAHSSAPIGCTICLDTQAQTSQKAMSCGHSFHEECIDMWLSKKNTCPVCRAVIGTNQPPPERYDFEHVFAHTVVAILMMSYLDQE